MLARKKIHRKKELLTDKEIIKGCLEEDRACQETLFSRYAGKMLTLCKRYARHDLEAQDMMQEGFIKVYNNLHQFRFQGSLGQWIRRIMINTALKHCRKSSFQKELLGLEYQPEIPHAPAAYSNLSEKELLAMIVRLPDGYKVVFNMFAIDGMSHKEIAETLGIKESTSRSQLVKARKYLQKLISQSQKIAV